MVMVEPAGENVDSRQGSTDEQIMHRSPPVAVIALAVLVSGCAAPGGEWTQCANVKADPDLAIAACTRAYGGARASGSGGWVMRPDARQAYALANRGTAHAVKREYDEALVDLRKAVQLDAGQAWMHYNLGITYAAKGDYAKARASLQDALKIDPKYDQATAKLAQVEAAMAGGRGGEPEELPRVRGVSVPPP